MGSACCWEFTGFVGSGWRVIEIYQEVGSCFDPKLEQGRVVLRVNMVLL